MSKNLKKSLIEKMDVTPSQDFDSTFFKKLESQKKRSGIFSHWFAWTISGCVTASVLFIAINNYRVPAHTFNHKEYAESVLEMQSSMTEDIAQDEMMDLTTSSMDEI